LLYLMVNFYKDAIFLTGGMVYYPIID